MSRSPAKSRKAITTKSLKEKWERSIQSMEGNGEQEVGGSSTITKATQLMSMLLGSGVSGLSSWAPGIHHQCLGMMSLSLFLSSLI